MQNSLKYDKMYQEVGIMSKKSKVLGELANIFESENIDELEFEEIMGDAEFVYDFKSEMEYVTDKREQGYVLHSLEGIILTVIFGIFAKCNTIVEVCLFMDKHYDWLEKHIGYENGKPSKSAITRVLAFVNPKEIEKVCTTLLEKFLKKNKNIYMNKRIEIEDIKSMDGKTANCSDRIKSKDGKISKMNAMSIYSLKNEYCEATEFIDKKTNEIPTGIELLKRVNIKKCLITFDAMNTQAKTIEYIVDNKGYYVAPVKGNQKNLEECIKDYFEDKELNKKGKKENYIKIIEKAHGTAETRECIFVNDVDWIAYKSDWKGLKAIGIITRTYEENGKEKKDTRYYITNIGAENIELLYSAIRGEWKIENQLHYYLDMVFEEDKSKAFVQNVQKNLNIIRKFCLAILKMFKEKRKLSMNALRFCINMDFENEIDNILKELYGNLK